MNNSFTQCVSNICGLELSTLANGYKYSVFGGKVCTIEGHKGICRYDEDYLCFLVKCGTLCISGKNLRIKCLDKSFAVVSGQILSVEVKV